MPRQVRGEGCRQKPNLHDQKNDDQRDHTVHDRETAFNTCLTLRTAEAHWDQLGTALLESYFRERPCGRTL